MTADIEAKKYFRLAIEQGRIPQYLYKYTSVDNCLKAINDGTLYFADYHTFNDPFECMAIIDSNNTEKEWFDFLIQNHTDRLTARAVAHDIVSDPQRAEKLIKDSVCTFQNSTGFLCLSNKKDNLLLWAHYAKQHEGCCIKIDLLNDIDLFYRIQHVTYDNKYLAYNYLRHQAGAFESICHKSKDWAYEEGYRIMDFHYIGAKVINPGTIKEIYLGCRIKDDDKKDILNAVAITKKQAGITVYQTAPDTQSYQLKFLKI